MNDRWLLTDPGAVAGLLREISTLARDLDDVLTIMEVCGTHTQAVAAAGLRRMLPAQVRLISGPGCPVCVTPVEYLDRAIALANLPTTTVCTFGDLMRVPSSTSSLERARARGASIEVVYSPRDALQLAAANPALRIVFLAVGFETTAPTSAAALAEAEATGIDNFLLLPGNKIMPPPMRAIVDDPDISVAGFLLPGHVSVITGWRAFGFLAEEYQVSGVVVGFAPTDVLQGIIDLLRCHRQNRPQVTNRYGRAVRELGNSTAAELIQRFFTPASTAWRGFGAIPGSGLHLKPRWAHRDASLLAVELPEPLEPKGCRCGDILRGIITPPECPLFDTSCTPDEPQGACMVSSEGTCSAWFKHERFSVKEHDEASA